MFDNEAGGYFDDTILVDLEAAYTLNDGMTDIVSARNVADEHL